ncbi:MAG TPA: DUF222 domain-containing protein [Acidimicrobiales bacterium]|nr:DUF222 domain-containing protein [Acidimicrobiales bacterium]
MLDGLAEQLDRLGSADPRVLADPATIEALHRQLARLEAVVTRATAAFEASGRWQESGARSATAWVANRCSLPRAAAHRRLRLGRALRHLPVGEAAWLAGRIDAAHVSALASLRTPAAEEALARDEEVLVAQAQHLRYREFARVLGYWAQVADPDGAEGAAERQREGRRLHLSRTLGGAWVLDGLLDPVAGAAVSAQLRRIETELFEADGPEARRRLGDHAGATEVARSAPQRRADALVEMALRAGSAPAGGRRPEPLFTVVVGYETLAGRVCELFDGTVVTPGSLAPWLGEAWVQRVVFDSPSRVIDVGVTRRAFDGATRRAVEVRDRECFHPMCEVGAEDCQVDHIIPWSAGGLTTMENGRLACGPHNRERHRRR